MPTHTSSSLDASGNKMLFSFTPRELSCVEQIAKENSLEKAAENLNISKNTIHFHLTNVRHKLELLLHQKSAASVA